MTLINENKYHFQTDADVGVGCTPVLCALCVLHSR